MDNNANSENSTSADNKPKLLHPRDWQRAIKVDININFGKKNLSFRKDLEKGKCEAILVLFLSYSSYKVYDRRIYIYIHEPTSIKKYTPLIFPFIFLDSFIYIKISKFL